MLTAWGRIAHRLADEHRTHEAPDLNTVHDEQGDVAVAADAATTCWESNTSQNRLI
jgi:hypothetical protein